MTPKIPLPIPVKRSLTRLGNDVRAARLRRRISTQIMADRVGITRDTLRKLENGSPGVSIGTYATVFFVLGMLDTFSRLADPKDDLTGRMFDEELLPQRIRVRGTKGV